MIQKFNFYISFLCSGIHNIVLLSTVAEKQVSALEAHKIFYVPLLIYIYIYISIQPHNMYKRFEASLNYRGLIVHCGLQQRNSICSNSRFIFTSEVRLLIVSLSLSVSSASSCMFFFNQLLKIYIKDTNKGYGPRTRGHKKVKVRRNRVK